MATGWERLGDSLFGGPDPGAYEAGRLHTAQTENALAQARTNQLKAIAAESQAKAIESAKEAWAQSGKDPMLFDMMVGGLGNDYSATMMGQQREQEMGFDRTLADPTASPAAQFAAGQARQGQVLNPYAQVGDSFVDLRAPVAPGAPAPLQRTALTDAKIGAENALAYQRRHPELSPSGAAESMLDPYHGAFGKPQPGEMANPNFDPALPASLDNRPFVPRPGSALDPNVGPALGTRERQVIGRVFNAAANTVGDIETITKMPSGADQGMLGIGLGAQPGVSVMDATAGNLKRTLASEEVRRYNSILGGFSNQLRTLEQMGLAGTQGAAAQYDTLAFTPQDNVGDKMFKLAQVRQSVENSVATIVALNQNMPDDAKQWAQQILAGIKRAVPYTREDVIAFDAASKKDPRLTLQQMITQRQMTQPVRPQAAAPAATDRTIGGQVLYGGKPARTDLPLRNAKGWRLLRDRESGDYAYVGPAGEIEEVQ